MNNCNKIMTLDGAISKFVHDRTNLYLGGFIQGEPYAIIYEIIRQRKKELTLSKAAGIEHVDMMIGAGCIKRLITSYLWNPIPKSAHAFRRSMEKGIPNRIELEEYTLLALSLAYLAGSMGLPFIATKLMLGTDYINSKSLSGHNNRCKVIDSPINKEKVCLVPGITHDVGIIQAQRADAKGNVQMWGVLGSTKYGINSCKKIIVCVEEIVSSEIIASDPNRTIIPAHKVDAVVELPWGSYPSGIQGYYDRDFRFTSAYERATQTVEGFNEYLENWIYGVSNHEEYMDKIGSERMEKLKCRKKMCFPVNYGDYMEFPKIEPLLF